MENQNPNQSVPENSGNATNEIEKKHIHAALSEGEIAKKSKVKKAIGIFLAEDAENIKDHLVDDYIKPRAQTFGLDLVRKFKEFLLDNITDIARTMIFGETKKTSDSEYKTGYYDGNSKVYYTSYYNGGYSYEDTSYRPAVKQETPSAAKLIVIKIPSYGKAEEIKGELLAIYKRFHAVPVADYYQMFQDKNGKPLIHVTKEHYNFGWKEFKEDIKIVYNTDLKGYQLILPKLVPLD